MNAEQLLAIYDRFAEAPDAVEKLRRFILDLAIRGKLTEQRADEEHATRLLQHIQTEKAALTAAKKIRETKKLTELESVEIPFLVPEGWIWTQIAKLGVVAPRNTAEDNIEASFVPMSSVKNRYGASHEQETRIWADIKKGYTHFADGDVALAKITPCFENAKSAVFRDLKNGIGAGTTELHVIRPIAVSPDYILAVLKSPYFIETGIGHMTGTAGQKRVPRDYFAGSPFPLPPLAEQHRIVAKVDELMALCDRLEATRTTRETTRDKLTTASLGRLTAADTDEPTFQSDARFALDTLPALTTRPDQIKTLRQTILDLAVRGKLVKQDSGDEPSTVTLKKMDADDAGNEPFPLPTSRRWVKGGSGAQTRLGKMLDKAKNKGALRPYLRNINVRWFDFDLSDLLEMRLQDSELIELELKKGDVLICEGGEPGRAAVWDQRANGVYFQKAIHRVRFASSVDPHFFVHALKASADDGRLAGSFTGVGIKHFTGKGLKNYRFPLPPINEQHRIVAKVDELMALCDQLETSLTKAGTTRSRLLESALHEALQPAAEDPELTEKERHVG